MADDIPYEGVLYLRGTDGGINRVNIVVVAALPLDSEETIWRLSVDTTSQPRAVRQADPRP
jgi:hypothetical protein